MFEESVFCLLSSSHNCQLKISKSALVHLAFLFYFINSPPPLALLKLLCGKNTFRGVLWSLIINWVDVWWNVGSRLNTDSFSLSLSLSRMPLVFTLLCLCVLKMGGFSASVTQATVQSGESRVWLSGCDWSVCGWWRMNPLLLSCPRLYPSS